MQTQSFTVAFRQSSGKGGARKLRALGKIPGIVYGEGQEARSVQLDRKAFDLLVRSGGIHGLLDLSFESGHEPVKALVREVQVHPVSRAVEHVDLQRISMRERIKLEVPIVLLGKPEGVKLQGGILEHSLRLVEVECLPSDIPQEIQVDVSHLNVGHSIHVSDLNVPGVTFMAHGETTVATVSLPPAERVAEVPVEAAAAEAAAAAATAEGAVAGEDKAEKGAKSEKGDKGEKAEKPGKAEKPVKAEKPGKGDKGGRS